MKFFEQYHLPTTVDEAVDLLTRYEGRARVIAGGTDLLVDLQGEQYDGARPHYDALIDVTRIAGADEIREEAERIVIGCGVTHTQIVESALIQKRATALAEACGVVGGPQVRNVATLIGNVAHALPAADGTIALMALEAEGQVASNRSQVVSNRSQVVSNRSQVVGPRWLPLSSLFLGPGQSSVDSSRELIAAVRFRPTDNREASAFSRVMRPQGVALPILAMAVRVKMRDDVIETIAISAGPVAPVPFRARRTEDFLRGKVGSPEILQQASQLLLNEVNPRTSPHRATKEYRYELLPNLLEQTVRLAIARVKDSTTKAPRHEGT